MLAVDTSSGPGTYRIMEKVKYSMLQRPTVTNWPTVPRQLKLALALTVFLLIAGVLIFKTPRSARLQKILYVQETLFEIFSLEMEFINKISSSIEDQWLPVDDLDGHVYSAYLDGRPEVIDQYARFHATDEITWAVIRIIAILPMDVDENQVDCIYKHTVENGTDTLKRIRATSVKPMEDNWNLKYSAFFVMCDLVVPENFEIHRIYSDNHLPSSVTIARYEIEPVKLTNAMQYVNVRYPNWKVNRSYDMQERFMAVCTPVFHHNFNRPLDVIEYVEYYLLLGANHFTFYNSSVSPDVDRVLRYYVNRDAATLLTWRLPSKYEFEKTLRSEGLFAAINDCLYRNLFSDKYDYVANFGVDEFLVPKVHNNFPELMEYLDPNVNGGNKHGSFLFRNAFFYTMYQDYNERDRNVPYLYTQAKTWRVKEPEEPGVLSRYIVRGKDTVELGNYRVARMREGSLTHTSQFDEVVVNPEVALSHHYSPCEAEETGCYLKSVVVDQTAHKFTKKLGPKVAAACRDVFGDAGCPFVKKQTLI